jgi:hypothetical protein
MPQWLDGEAASEVTVMQSLVLMVIYVLTTISVQFVGFLISRLINYEWPTLGLMTFLLLFLAAFGIAWPIAVRIAEWLIRSRGYVIQTEQTGLAGRQAEEKEHQAKLAARRRKATS